MSQQASLSGRRALLARLLRKKRVAYSYPLSHGQQALWFMYQSVPDSPAYNMALPLELEGELNVKVLRQALQALVNRHLVLQSTISLVDGEAMQTVHPSGTYEWHEHLWHGSEAELELALRRAYEQPFDLTSGPVLRATLFQRAPQHHILLLTIHHIWFDGSSINILGHELLALYEAKFSGQKASLPAIPTSYADYVRAEMAGLNDSTGKQLAQYWQDQLDTAPPRLDLPTDYARPAVQNYHGASVPFCLGADLTQQLKQLAQREKSTLFSLLLTAFQTLLHRYTGQNEIWIGTPTSIARRQPEFANLIGYLVNPVVLRTTIEPTSNLSFIQLLSQTKQTVVEAIEHSAYPFPLLVKSLQPQRDLSYAPLFQVMFDFQPKITLRNKRVGDLTVLPLAMSQTEGLFDLTLTVSDHGEKIVCGLKYSTDLFAPATIERMVGHLQTLLGGIAPKGHDIANPAQPIAELPMLTEAERQQILVAWNDTATDYPIHKTIHQLFEEQVKRTPNQIAVVFESNGKTNRPRKRGEGQTCCATYAELNQQANQLAHHLQALGVGPEVLVALCVERSIEMVVGLLAILKAGGAYLPLDPNYPAERLAFMLTDATVSLLLTQSHLLDTLPQISCPKGAKANVVCLDSDWTVIERLPSVNLEVPVKPDNLAYVIYTSGSTGKPKGVLIESGSLAHHISHIVKRYQINTDDRILQFASISFDAAQEQIFSALTTGSTLLLPDDNLWPIQKFNEKVLEYGLTVTDLPPSYFHQLVEHWQKDAPKFFNWPLRLMIIGGEKIQPHTIRLWQQLSNCPIQLLNAYGPTETTITATLFDLTHYQVKATTQNLPIGQALAGRQLYIVNQNLEPVPVGVVGELLIGGVGVARGYLNRPQLTAEKFIRLRWTGVRNPYGEGRLYKSGDLVRWLPDTQGAGSGNIEFLGRLDHQVKIRGFRIELGEIETVLSQHEAVQDVVVMARGEASGQKRLVAYLIPNPLRPTPDLRSYLQEKLPDYMIPSAFVMLEQFPLTPNGKIDRQALPAPNHVPLDSLNEFVLPQTPTEEILARIWAEVLGVKRVGRYDNFFELGGDSIISLQVISRANTQGVHLTPRQIFEAQTIADLALLAQAKSSVQAEQGLVLGTLPLTPIQQWFFERGSLNPHHFNQSVLRQLEATIEPSHLSDAVAYLLNHHDALRLRFSQTAQGWQQHLSAPQTVNQPRLVTPATLAAWTPQPQDLVTVFEINGLPEQEALTAINRKLQESLHLVNGPLMRLGLIRGEQVYLLWVIHHLAVDFVSWRILEPDLWTVTEQIARQQPPRLAAKSSSFKAWADWLADSANQEQLLPSLSYWLKMGQLELSPLPVDAVAQKSPHTALTPQPPLPRGEGEKNFLRRNSPSNSYFSPLSLRERGVGGVRAGLGRRVVFALLHKNTVASAAEVTVRLSVSETKALLQDVPPVYHTQINDILLTALTQTVADWTGQANILLALEGHGREPLTEEIDLSRTVGWFTSQFPICLRLEGSEIGTKLKSIKEQLRQIPHRGVSFGLLRYLNQSTAPQLAQLAQLPQPEISFNYGGQFKGPASQSLGHDWSPEQQLTELISINGGVINEQLSLSFLYSQNLYHRQTIQTLAEHFITTLQQIINHCQQPQVGGYTPSDFPLAHSTSGQAALSQKQLDSLIGQGENVADIYPLSPMQSGMLFHTLYAPTSGVYFTQLTFELVGELNLLRWQQAWQAVVARHTSLRTAFEWHDLPAPLQVVYQQVTIPWQVLDWRHLSKPEQKTALDTLMQSGREQGVELSQAPLMRCTLIRMADERYQFVWHSHHLLIDGWSNPIIFQEVFTLYQDETHILPSPRPYRSYIAWLQQQDLAEAERFWGEQLAGFTTPTPLTVDKGGLQGLSVSTTEPTYQTLKVEFSPELTEQMAHFARQHRLTQNTLLQGVYALLLSRYSGQEEVLFGVTVAGRPGVLEGVERMVGLFINTLPLRVAIPQTKDIVSWLEALQIQSTIQNNYAYAPLAQIQQLAEIPAGASLFESILVFENYPLDESRFSNLNSIDVQGFATVEQTNYPLTIAAIPQKRFTLSISYDRNRFDAQPIERMAGHLETLLAGIIANPAQPIADLPLLTEAERQQILVAWNNTATNYPADKTIHQLFEEHAAAEGISDNIAVVFEAESLTYSELNQRANQLAHHLQALGVGPEVLVGICVERSIEMVVGLLGILKAGGAYLPLDPNYPAERLAFMLEDADLSLLLTQSHLLDTLPQTAQGAAEVVCLDSDWALIDSLPSVNLEVAVKPDNLAYVIYTSGSTGKPKGTLVIHRSVIRLVKETTYIQFDQKQIFLQLAPLSFDASTLEIWGPFLNGGRLVIMPPHQPSLKEIADYLTRYGITTLWLTAGLFHLMVDEHLNDLSSLKQLLAGGDVLSVDHVRQAVQVLTDGRLINGYGPTENTTFTCCYPVQDLDRVKNSVPIGRPISNTQVYILDQYLKPVPIGVLGELYISGVGLSRGYLNRPELTEQKFIPNPYGEGRLYKSGDLARWLPDTQGAGSGNIEFIGRIDHQVKIRGFRIELGEIETVLSQHEAVQQVVVVAKASAIGTQDSGVGQQKRLVAYFVPTSLTPNPQSLTPELRPYLQEKLPAYMIPSAFVILDQFPLTPNGKIDRQALPAPDSTALVTSNEFVAPQTPTEQILASVWADVLGREPVGRHDNFFELGGHSLLATQVVSRLRMLFEVKIEIRMLFETPTIATLAEQIDILAIHLADSRAPIQKLDEKQTPTTSFVPLRRGDDRAPLFLIHPAGGVVFPYLTLSSHLSSAQPVYALQARGIYDELPPFESLEALATATIQEMKTIQPHGAYTIGGWSFGGMVAFEIARQLTQQGDEVSFLGVIDAYPRTSDQVTSHDIQTPQEELQAFFYLLGDQMGGDYRRLPDDLFINALSQQQPVDWLLDQLSQQGIRFALSHAIIKRIWQTIKRNTQLMQTYQPQPYSGTITLFCAQQSAPQDGPQRWQTLTPHHLDTVWVSGEHQTMLNPEHVETLGRELEKRLQ